MQSWNEKFNLKTIWILRCISASKCLGKNYMCVNIKSFYLCFLECERKTRWRTTLLCASTLSSQDLYTQTHSGNKFHSSLIVNLYKESTHWKLDFRLTTNMQGDFLWRIFWRQESSDWLVGTFSFFHSGTEQGEG